MVRHGTLSHRPGIAGDADATLTIARCDLDDIVLGRTTLQALIEGGAASVEGDAGALRDFVALLDDVESWFDIVTPWGRVLTARAPPRVVLDPAGRPGTGRTRAKGWWAWTRSLGRSTWWSSVGRRDRR